MNGFLRIVTIIKMIVKAGIIKLSLKINKQMVVVIIPIKGRYLFLIFLIWSIIITTKSAVNTKSIPLVEKFIN